MKTVVVKAVNLKEGDVLVGKSNQRIKAIHRFTRRNNNKSNDKDASKGVVVIAPNPNGYKLDSLTFPGHKPVKVKRPLYNMEYRRAKKKS